MYNKISIFFLALLFCLAVAATEAEARRFGGLWMKDCKGKTGLGIIPDESSEAESYYISFCGRGGCMPPTKERPNTTVEGDSNYNVINVDHIQILEDDEWQDYIKCRKI